MNTETPKSEIQREIEAHAERPGWTPEAKALLDAAALHQRIGELERELSRVTESIRNLCALCGFQGDGTLMGVYEAVESMKLAIAGLTEERDEMEARAMGLVLRTPEDTTCGEIRRWRDEAKAKLVALAATQNLAADQAVRLAKLATERDAALRRVREIEVSALATLQSWDALRSAHDGRDESERRAFADSIAALKARLDVAEKGG